MSGVANSNNNSIQSAEERISILFDHQIFMSQRRGGISRYFVELIRHLPKADPRISAPFPNRRTTNDHVLEAGLADPFPRLLGFGRHQTLSARWNRATRQMSQRLPRPKMQRDDDLTIYHPTYYSQNDFLQVGFPVVVTVYDMIPELFPSMFKRNPHLEKAWFLERADAVIAISESTAQDVRRFHPNLAVPIDVVPLAVDTRCFKPDGDRIDAFPRPWVLFVGNRARYKDFEVLLNAVARAAMRDVHVVAVSADGPSSADWAAIGHLGLEGRVTFVSATDEQLGAFYRGADAFVFPSRYEGFGLPTLEALSCGTPTILAQSSSHLEVGGNACLYFDPGDADILAERLAELLSDGALRQQLRHRGLERASAFSWGRTAAMTAAVYRRIANSGRR